MPAKPEPTARDLAEKFHIDVQMAQKLIDKHGSFDRAEAAVVASIVQTAIPVEPSTQSSQFRERGAATNSDGATASGDGERSANEATSMETDTVALAQQLTAAMTRRNAPEMMPTDVSVPLNGRKQQSGALGSAKRPIVCEDVTPATGAYNTRSRWNNLRQSAGVSSVGVNSSVGGGTFAPFGGADDDGMPPLISIEEAAEGDGDPESDLQRAILASQQDQSADAELQKALEMSRVQTEEEEKRALASASLASMHSAGAAASPVDTGGFPASAEDIEMNRALLLSLQKSGGGGGGGGGGAAGAAATPSTRDLVPCGLRNVGNTCYFNSMLQTYFWVEPLRRAVLHFPCTEAAVCARLGVDALDERRKRLVEFMHALQRLFVRMLVSDATYQDPSALLKTLRRDDGTVVRVGAQEDVGEFNMLFVERVEEALALMDRKADDAAVQYGGGALAKARVAERDEALVPDSDDESPPKRARTGSPTDSAPPTSDAHAQRGVGSMRAETPALASSAPMPMPMDTADDVLIDEVVAASARPNLKRERAAAADGADDQDSELSVCARLFSGEVHNFIECEEADGTAVQVVNRSRCGVLSVPLPSGAAEQVELVDADDKEAAPIDYGECALYDGLARVMRDHCAYKTPLGHETEARTTQWFARVPHCLMLQQNRFEFNRQTGVATKLHTRLNVLPALYVDRFLVAARATHEQWQRDTNGMRQRLEAARARLRSLQRYGAPPGLPLHAALLASMQALQDAQLLASPLAEHLGRREAARQVLHEAALAVRVQHHEQRGVARHCLAALRRANEGARRHEYRLWGVWIHSGAASSGHYYAYLRIGGSAKRIGSDEKAAESNVAAGDWFKFNDTRVTRARDADVLAAASGGQTHTSTSAYFLIYVRSDALWPRVCRSAPLSVEAARDLVPRDLLRIYDDEVTEAAAPNTQTSKERALMLIDDAAPANTPSSAAQLATDASAADYAQRSFIDAYMRRWAPLNAMCSSGGGGGGGAQRLSLSNDARLLSYVHYVYAVLGYTLGSAVLFNAVFADHFPEAPTPLHAPRFDDAHLQQALDAIFECAQRNARPKLARASTMHALRLARTAASQRALHVAHDDYYVFLVVTQRCLTAMRQMEAANAAKLSTCLHALLGALLLDAELPELAQRRRFLGDLLRLAVALHAVAAPGAVEAHAQAEHWLRRVEEAADAAQACVPQDTHLAEAVCAAASDCERRCRAQLQNVPEYERRLQEITRRLRLSTGSVVRRRDDAIDIARAQHYFALRDDELHLEKEAALRVCRELSDAERSAMARDFGHLYQWLFTKHVKLVAALHLSQDDTIPFSAE